ncbi:MAG: AMP-binding protein [Arhodomonas sp.]|nr:AMP-binding protein [Arhodomonas sp.]
MPVNAKLAAAELGYILSHSSARICFATSDLVGTVNTARQDADGLEAVIDTGSAAFERWFQEQPLPLTDRAPDDLAWLFYTSGTTGIPKGAMLSHRNLMAMTSGYFIDVESVDVGTPSSMPPPLPRLRPVLHSECGRGGATGDPGERRLRCR